MPELKSPDLPAHLVHEYEPLLDSSNMTPANWVDIAQDIVDVHDDYDGFVVLHGTDTLAYTASALPFMLHGLPSRWSSPAPRFRWPTCAATPGDNLITALIFAGQCDIAEVTVCFDGKLLRGSRALKVDADRFRRSPRRTSRRSAVSAHASRCHDSLVRARIWAACSCA